MSPLDHGDNSNLQTTPSHAQRARRIQFLFVVAAAQGLSILEGSLGLLPRRFLVEEERGDEARRILTDAGLADELREDKA